MKRVILYLTVVLFLISILSNIHGRPMLKRNHPFYELTKEYKRFDLATVSAKGHGSKTLKKAMGVEQLE